ncbi:MAG: response regulator transcription factor [Ruminococcaceae bacterium]|nr:response regulator transcription factor [Oscillospiraceae bacterium]
MNVKDKILVVEDESSITRFIRAILMSNGYDVITAASGSEACSMISSHCPDLVLLDLGLPDVDGVQIIETVRQWTQIPIIVVSARSFDRDKVEALDKGSDDYITKPFSAAELLARIRVALRHSRSSTADDSVAMSGKFTTGELTIDYDKHQVLIGGQNAKLTQNEFRIVALLGKYAGKVLTYDFIMKELWGPQSKGNNQILRVNMANIRRKLEKNPAEPAYIFTEVGVGYRMSE